MIITIKHKRVDSLPSSKRIVFVTCPASLKMGYLSFSPTHCSYSCHHFLFCGAGTGSVWPSGDRQCSDSGEGTGERHAGGQGLCCRRQAQTPARRDGEKRMASTQTHTHTHPHAVLHIHRSRGTAYSNHLYTSCTRTQTNCILTRSRKKFISTLKTNIKEDCIKCYIELKMYRVNKLVSIRLLFVPVQLEKCSQDLGTCTKAVSSAMAQLLSETTQGNENYTGTPTLKYCTTLHSCLDFIKLYLIYNRSYISYINSHY